MRVSVLEVTNLTKSFGPRARGYAVDKISFSVDEGEIVGLLGPNGAGKTTTLAMIMGLTLPSFGEIRVFGKDLMHEREEILGRMSYASAYTRAPLMLKVWEHLYVFALLYEVDNPKARVDEVIASFRLIPHKDTYAGDLSAGNLARLNLAKAFIPHPKLVLLDEPTSSLDPDIADRVRQFIKDAREKFHTTILITSHNMAEIEELCDRVIFMSHGKIAAIDTPEGLAKKHQTAHVRLMMKDGQKRTLAFAQKAGFPATAKDRFVTLNVDEQDIAYLLAGLADLGVSYSEIAIDKPTLEDYFIGEARHED